MTHNNLTISLEDPTHPDSLRLIERLSAELGARYGDDGSGAFAPADAQGPRAAFVVVRMDGEPVGCGALKPFDASEQGTTAEIKRMFVEPAMRGQGISRKILQALEDAAISFGYDTLKLETGIRQPEAIGLYEASGFHRTECYGQYAGQPLSVCYEKQIGPPGG
jgi:putative acetyltransferase